MHRFFTAAALGCFLAAPALAAETVWIDVRSALEHKLDHINGDLRITHTDIVPVVTERFADKDTEIVLYCRSGRRAGEALEALEAAGYTDVTNAGGIEAARRQRELTE